VGLDQLTTALTFGAVVVLLAVVGVRFAGRLGLPGLLLYLGIGVALAAVPGLIDFDDPRLATVLGYSALVVILAEGGLTTRLSQLRPVLWPSLLLATVGVAISIAAVSLPLIWLAGLDARTAMLLGAVLSATDAAAVFAVLRRLHVVPRLRTMLEGEAGFNDAPVVVVVALLSSPTWDSAPAWSIPVLVVVELLGGAAVGLLVGLAARWVMPRLALPAVGLYPVAALAFLVLAYGLADLVHASGFLAVYVAAVSLGSTDRLPHRRAVLGFAEGLSWSAEIGLFVMLGMLADLEKLPAAVWPALVAGVALVLLGRPLGSLAALLPFRLPASWLAFSSVAGLRGAVPIVFAAIPLGAAVPGGDTVFAATFLIVVVLTLLQAPTLPWLVRRLGVGRPGEAEELAVESAPLDGMNATVLALDIATGSGFVGTYVDDLALPDGAVASLVVRGGRATVPDRMTRLRPGDRLVVVASSDAREPAVRRLRAVARGGRLARWRGERGEPD
jgi:potassium/hydrogen antiporter